MKENGVDKRTVWFIDWLLDLDTCSDRLVAFSLMCGAKVVSPTKIAIMNIEEMKSYFKPTWICWRRTKY